MRPKDVIYHKISIWKENILSSYVFFTCRQNQTQWGRSLGQILLKSPCPVVQKKTFIGNRILKRDFKIVVYLNHTFSFIANIFFVFFGSNTGWFFEFSQVSGVVPMIWQYWIENGQNNTSSHLVTLEDRHTVDRLTEIPKSECWVFAARHNQPLSTVHIKTHTVHIYFLL